MVAVTSPLFAAGDAQAVLGELRAIDARLLGDLGVDLDLALRGDEHAVRRYVADYRILSMHVAREAGLCWLDDAEPGGPTAQQRDNRTVARPGGGVPLRIFLDVLANAAADVPFLPWAGGFALGDAVGLELSNRARQLLGSEPLDLRQPITDTDVATRVVIDEDQARRFIARVRHCLNHPDDDEPLKRLIDAFGLSKTELGGLFGVSRQAIDKWMRDGVPADRQEKLTTLLALVDLLERKLKHGRLPGVARRRADAYGGQTMLERIREGRHHELLDSVRASFDWHLSA
jgi:transcriptional regulator with XRE-family HTH domain